MTSTYFYDMNYDNLAPMLKFGVIPEPRQLTSAASDGECETDYSVSLSTSYAEAFQHARQMCVPPTRIAIVRLCIPPEVAAHQDKENPLFVRVNGAVRPEWIDALRVVESDGTMVLDWMRPDDLDFSAT